MIEFGSYNVLTGESKQGYLDKDGKMQFRPIPWYKRIFQRKNFKETSDISVTEYIGTTQFYSQWIWSNHKEIFTVAVYRTYNKLSGSTISVYSDIADHGRKYYNVDAFNKDKILIPL